MTPDEGDIEMANDNSNSAGNLSAASSSNSVGDPELDEFFEHPPTESEDLVEQLKDQFALAQSGKNDAQKITRIRTFSAILIFNANKAPPALRRCFMGGTTLNVPRELQPDDELLKLARRSLSHFLRNSFKQGDS